MRFVRTLYTNLSAEGDFSEMDDVGRKIQVRIIGRYAVTFWADRAVFEIKIIQIKLADR